MLDLKATIKITHFISALIALSLSGCVNTGGTESLSSLQKMKGKFVRHDQNATKHYRDMALKETAISI